MSSHLDFHCKNCAKRTDLWCDDYRPSLYATTFALVLRMRDHVAALAQPVEGSEPLHTTIFKESFAQVALFFKEHAGHTIVVVDSNGNEYQNDGRRLEPR